jgi:hypothetical protein
LAVSPNCAKTGELGAVVHPVSAAAGLAATISVKLAAAKAMIRPGRTMT